MVSWPIGVTVIPGVTQFTRTRGAKVYACGLDKGPGISGVITILPQTSACGRIVFPKP
jgi:hypothetical protein